MTARTAHAATYSPRHPASTYNCTPSHCYGQVAWWNTSQLWTGAKMDWTIDSMGCSESGCSTGNQTDFVESAVWLGDQSSWATSNCTVHLGCWVESGDITYYDSFFGHTNVYYWADNRPCITSGNKYATHYGSSNTYEMGNTDTATIQYNTSSTWPSHNCNNKATSWNLTTTDPMYGSVWNGLPNVSTNNPMEPMMVQVGMEVAGTSGESSSNTIYSHINEYDSSQWWDLSTFSNGDYYNQQSPVHSWYTLPGPGHVWYWDAYCTCAPF